MSRQRHEICIEKAGLPSGFTHVQVSVSYNKDGRRRGYYMYAYGMRVEGEFMSTTLMDNFHLSMLLVETPRFNAKQFDIVANAVVSRADAIADFLAAGKKQEATAFVKGITDPFLLSLAGLKASAA